MKTLALFHPAEHRRLPEDWEIIGAPPVAEEHALRVRPGSGLRIPLPGYGWRRITVDIDVEVEPAGTVCMEVSVRPLRLLFELQPHGYHCIQRVPGGEQAGASARPDGLTGGRRRLQFVFSATDASIRMDGETVVHAASVPVEGLSPSALLVFDSPVRLQTLRITGEDTIQNPHPPAPRRKALELEVAVDFYDDLLRGGPYDQEMMNELFREIASWGTRRVQYFYYGDQWHGWWDDAPRASKAAAETFAGLGGMLPAAVRSAHAAGLEIQALIKPFDMGLLGGFHAPETAEAKARGKLKRIGGTVGWICDEVVRRRDLCMQRKPGTFGPALNDTFTRIDLVKEDAREAAFGVGDLQLFVSDDNRAYRRYEGPMERVESIEDVPVWEHTASGGRATGERRRCRVMSLRTLDLRAPYFVLRSMRRSNSFAHSLVNLIHVYGPAGEERRLTYGGRPRADLDRKTRAEQQRGTFETVGVLFDAYPSSPTANRAGWNGMTARYVFDREGKGSCDGSEFLAIARGKQPDPLAGFSPSHPDARAWWLRWVSEALDAGADGIEFRTALNHHREFSWHEFGFEPHVVAAFKERYGVDLLQTDDFDPVALRRLRGEAYTDFLRQARDLVTRRGKRLGLHVSHPMELEPEWGGAMNIHWDWRTWIDEGIADRVTLKEVDPSGLFGRAVMARARARGIPAVYSVYANGALGSEATARRFIPARVRLADEAGCDGYQLYESASLVGPGPDRHQFVTRYPDIKTFFRERFGP